MAKYTSKKNEKFEKRNSKDNRKGSNSNRRDSDSHLKSNSQNYSGNHIEWYTKHAELVSSAAKIPFAYQPGRPVPVLDKTDWVGKQDTEIIYPGINILSFVPTIGRSTDIQSPVNVAAREIYADIRAKYSGSLEADAPDIMMYILAVDSLNMLIEDAKRVYYLVNMYTPDNTQFPRAIIKGLGWDVDDVRTNKMQLFTFINQAAAIASKFLVPGHMSINQRHAFLNANLFSDSSSAKSQIYAFKMHGWYKLDAEDGPTSLYYYKRPDTMTVQEWFNQFNATANTLMLWDTSYTIVGYFQRAYESGFLIPAPATYEAVISPVYDENICRQIHNSTVVNMITDVRKYSGISQDVLNGNMIVYDPRAISTLPIKHKYILDFPGSTQPDDATIISGTRLTSVVEPSKGTGAVQLDCGTEVIVSSKYILDQEGTYVDGTITNTYDSYSVSANGDIDVTSQDYVSQSIGDYRSLIKTASLMSTFNWHPIIMAAMTDVYSANEAENTSYPMVFGQLENFTSVDADVIANLHRLCIYSEFNCF